MSKYPNTINFLKSAMTENVNRELAHEISTLIKYLYESLNENATLEKEVATLKHEVEVLKKEKESLLNALPGYNEEMHRTPVYPDGFHFYGDGPLSYTLTDKEIQEFVTEAFNTPLGSSEFYETGTGDTVILKLRFGDENKIIVARGYAEYVYHEDDEVDGSHLL